MTFFSTPTTYSSVNHLAEKLREFSNSPNLTDDQKIAVREAGIILGDGTLTKRHSEPPFNANVPDGVRVELSTPAQKYKLTDENGDDHERRTPAETQCDLRMEDL